MTSSMKRVRKTPRAENSGVLGGQFKLSEENLEKAFPEGLLKSIKYGKKADNAANMDDGAGEEMRPKSEDDSSDSSVNVSSNPCCDCMDGSNTTIKTPASFPNAISPYGPNPTPAVVYVSCEVEYISRA